MHDWGDVRDIQFLATQPSVVHENKPWILAITLSTQHNSSCIVPKGKTFKLSLQSHWAVQVLGKWNERNTSFHNM